MIKRAYSAVRAAAIWVKALDADIDGDSQRAVILVDRMGAFRPLRAKHLAFKATALIKLGRSEEAREYLLSALSLLNDAEDYESRYVRLYCRIYLLVMSDDGPVENLIADALEIPTSKSLARSLPLQKGSFWSRMISVHG